jgi:hypothetical protein
MNAMLAFRNDETANLEITGLESPAIAPSNQIILESLIHRG